MIAAPVSLCMIVKDEEANLPGCLESVADLVHEIVIVDTGSADRTPEIAAGHGAPRVVPFQWTDDFSAARNESIRHARGDWIFYLDADERFDEPNRQQLRALFLTLGREIAGYSMTQQAMLGGVDVGPGLPGIGDRVQLFRNHPLVRWERRLHEQIVPSITRAGGRIYRTRITVHHQVPDASRLERKRQRNLRLLRLAVADDPADATMLFYLGGTLLELGKTDEALTIAQQCVAVAKPESRAGPLSYFLLVDCLLRSGQVEAARRTCREGRTRYPADPGLWRAEAMLSGGGFQQHV